MRAVSFGCLLALAGCDIVLGLDKHTDGGNTGGEPLFDAPRPDGEPVGCPVEYDKIVQTTASRYRIVGSSEKWSNARALCASDKPGFTHLLVLSNQQEWSAIVTELQGFLTVDTWVGFSDLKTEGTFLWITNETTTYASTGRVPPWDFDQPETPGTQSADANDCAAMRPISGVLHDDDCTNNANYICECDGYQDNSAR